MDTPHDPRIDFIGNFVQKTLKLKPEKWARLMATEEQRDVVMDFLNKPEPLVLLILQNNAAQLLATAGFPASLKSKSAYFVKRAKGAVPKEEISGFLILGDLAARPIEQLAALVDEVFVPLLSNRANHQAWPSVVAQDIQRHIHSLQSTVYQVRGQVGGHTVLPLPVGVDRVHEAERALVSSGGDVVDLYLKSAIEGVIIKWATQINDVLSEDPSQAFNHGHNPTPSAEMHFWSARLDNLKHIYEQLRDERVRKMAVILERTDSAYFPCFKTIFRNIVAALAEAKDIVIYLKPLKKHFSALEETDFSEISPLLRPMMHVVCLVWAHSRYYCNSAKIIVLLRQVCNLLIHQAKRYLDPSSIFQTDVDEAKQRIQLSITTLKLFREIYDDRKENLACYFKDREPTLWTFHPKMVFERFQKFLERLQTVQEFFDTVVEFMKLEKVEIGGVKGRILGSKVNYVFSEFSDLFASFGAKSYDPLDPEDDSFPNDYNNFTSSIQDLDRRLAAVLCQAFDDCYNLESVFKLVDIVGSVLDRPLIKEEFTGRYKAIVDMLNAEVNTTKELYEEQIERLERYGYMPLDKNMPPVAGALRWTRSLRLRVSMPVISFTALQHPITTTTQAQSVLQKYELLLQQMTVFEDNLFADWASSVPQQCEENLHLNIITRKSDGRDLILNFHPQLTAILREVRYLQQLERDGIPQEALDLYEKAEIFRKYTNSLNQTIHWYNKICRSSKPVEFELIKDSIMEVDNLVERGRCELTWDSEDSVLWEYIQTLHTIVHGLETRVQKTQDNVEHMRNILAPWSRMPVFTRKEGLRDTLLNLEDRKENVERRYHDIEAAASEIHSLLSENMKLFGMEEKTDSEIWLNYVDYVDAIVSDALLRAVGCRCSY